MAILCENNQSMENDLEDGEIEDDDEDQLVIDQPSEPEKGDKVSLATVNPPLALPQLHEPNGSLTDTKDKHNLHTLEFREGKERSHRRSERHHNKHESRSNRKRHDVEVDDDYASGIEKAIASVLKRDKEPKGEGESDVEEDKKKSRKRKKKERDRDKKRKRRRSDGEVNLPEDNLPGLPPIEEEIDEDEMLCVRGGSPKPMPPIEQLPPHFDEQNSPYDGYDSYDSEYDSDSFSHRKRNYDRDRDKKRDRSNKNRDGSKRERKRDKNRDKKAEKPRPVMQDTNNICLFYMQGKCHKGDDCPYSHAAMPILKMELCKFYLMDCCAKRDKCLYMHSEFPCKYFHTGLRCAAGERGQCKFSHGSPLSDSLKQVLLKHLESAPKEILGDFPRLSREGAQHLVNAMQKKLEAQLEPHRTSTTAPTKSNIPSLLDITIPMPAQMLHQNADENNIQNMHNSENNSQTLQQKTKSPRSRPSRWNSEQERVDINVLALTNPGLLNLNPATFNVPSQNANATSNNSGGNNNIFESLNVQDQQKIQHFQSVFGFQGFAEKDQDMRVVSNGDVDMRSLSMPPQPSSSPTHDGASKHDEKTDTDKSHEEKAKTDLDLRSQDMHDTDRLVIDQSVEDDQIDDDEHDNQLEIDVKFEDEKEPEEEKEEDDEDDVPSNLPKKQRELYLRIKAQQKENLPRNDDSESGGEPDKDDWYSSDDEPSDSKNKSTSDNKNNQQKSDLLQPMEIKPTVIEPFTLDPEKMSELSKIDISAEVTKLLSMVKNQALASTASPPRSTSSDPRSQPRDPRQQSTGSHSTETSSSSSSKSSAPTDPRMRQRKESTEKENRSTSDHKHERRMTIYEHGSLDPADENKKDVDLRNIASKDLDLRVSNYIDLNSRNSRSDVDLRQLNLPFKPIQNYVPATEIDASINSHHPIQYRVHICDIPRPDYSGLKLNPKDAQTTVDPRIRQIFRLYIAQNEIPEIASPDPVPLGSPKQPSSSSASTTSSVKTIPVNARIDPRMQRKPSSKSHEQAGQLQNPDQMNESASLSYTQQMQLLQNSVFYQSLSSNQKLILNQALATQKSEQNSVQNDPILAAILANLGLTQTSINAPVNPILNIMSLLNLGAGFNNSNMNQGMGPQMGPMGPMGPNNMQQPAPSLLGPGPGTPMMGNMGPMGPGGMMGGPPNDFGNMGYGPMGGNPPGLLGHSPYQGGQFGGDPEYGFGDNGNQYFGGNDMEFGFGGNNQSRPPNMRGERNYRGDRSNRRGGRGNWNSGGPPNRPRNFQARKNNNRSNRSRTPP